MSKETECKHEISKLQFSKMIINDNGSIHYQHIEILLKCDCGYKIFIHCFSNNIKFIVNNDRVESFLELS